MPAQVVKRLPEGRRLGLRAEVRRRRWSSRTSLAGQGRLVFEAV